VADRLGSQDLADAPVFTALGTAVGRLVPSLLLDGDAATAPTAEGGWPKGSTTDEVERVVTWVQVGRTSVPTSLVMEGIAVPTSLFQMLVITLLASAITDESVAVAIDTLVTVLTVPLSDRLPAIEAVTVTAKEDGTVGSEPEAVAVALAVAFEVAVSTEVVGIVVKAVKGALESMVASSVVPLAKAQNLSAAMRRGSHSRQ